MASVFLDLNETFNIGSNANARVFGQTGTELVIVEAGAVGLELDQNVERTDFSSNVGDYNFLQQGNRLLVFTDDTLVATVPIQGDSDGSQLVFADGSVSVKLTAGVLNLGGTPVSSSVAGTVVPAVIDTTITTMAVPTPGASIVTVNATTAGEQLDAAGSDVTFEITTGNYNQVIDNFSAGDILDFPNTNAPTVNNVSFTDNTVQLQFADAGQVATVTLIGLSTADDPLLNSVADFDTLFGVGTII